MKDMKKNVLILTGLIVFYFPAKLSAQVNIPKAMVEELTEKNILITDREVYAAGEPISFSAVNCSSSDLKQADWSNVLYVELITPDGESIARKKYAFDREGGSGAITIPDWALTGNYYLRAYTRWMRDYSPYSYFYKLVTVINPVKAELLEPEQGAGEGVEATPMPIVSSGFVDIHPSRSVFSKREQVSVELKFKDRDPDDNANCCVSVVPSGVVPGIPMPMKRTHENSFTPDFIPETRGLSVSGRVVAQGDSIPLPYTTVALTVFKENPEVLNVLTDKEGRFFFDLSNVVGSFEMFISAKSLTGQNPLILVDNDFSTDDIHLPFVPLDLSEVRKEVYRTVIFNAQMAKLYRQEQLVRELLEIRSDSVFYGIPDFTLKIDQYVDLPTVRDYIYEVMPQVRVRKHGDVSQIHVLGAYAEMDIYEPLVLIDMVPVFDMERILALQPQNLERIEVVTMPYIRGEIIYGGIVSLFSKRHDLGGIDLPSTGRFVDYSMLSADSVSTQPAASAPRVPDLRNCLYWNPALRVESGQWQSFSFQTGDNSGAYSIVVRFIDKTGRIRSDVQEIVVK